MTRADTYTSLLEHFARYFDACDRCDLDGIMAVLAGATVTAGASVSDDPGAIRALYEARQPAPLADGRRVTKHHVTNLIVDGPDDAGALMASAYYVRLEAGSPDARIAASGRLTQTVLPEGTSWRVLHHHIISDF